MYYTMLRYTNNAMLHLLDNNSTHFMLPHEYNNHVGLLLRNRMTGHYAPEFTVDVYACRSN